MPAFPIINGANIIAQTKVEITPGKPLTYLWVGHGFKVHVPTDAISSESGPVTLSIQASLSGDYQLPDDRVLVSAVYWLALHPPVKFNDKVTITIQHCASVNNGDSAFSFVTAKCTQRERPYTFKSLPGGSFSNCQTGSIKVRHFSAYSVIGPEQATNYAFCTHYIHEMRNIYVAHISVTKNLKILLTVCSL